MALAHRNQQRQHQALANQRRKTSVAIKIMRQSAINSNMQQQRKLLGSE